MVDFMFYILQNFKKFKLNQMSLTKQANFHLKEEGAFTSSSINLIVWLGSK